MAKKKSSPANEDKRASFMFPLLHQNVANEVADSVPSTWFNEENTDQDSTNEYLTHVKGKFTCDNDACATSGWGSRTVTIQIRGYRNNGYNAVVFNQRCESCKQLGSLTLNKQSYVERVAYRVKKWAGVPVEHPVFSEKEGLPHREDLCEGCKRGICRQRNDWSYY